MKPTVAFQLESLTVRHLTTRFACGTEALDSHLRHRALRLQRAAIARTFVAIEPARPRVPIAFATTVLGTLQLSTARAETMQTHLQTDVPVLRVTHFGVSAVLQRFGIGTGLLLLLARRALALAAQGKARALVCDAPNVALKPDTLARLCLQPLQSSPPTLLLPLATVWKGVQRL